MQSPARVYWTKKAILQVTKSVVFRFWSHPKIAKLEALEAPGSVEFQYPLGGIPSVRVFPRDTCGRTEENPFTGVCAEKILRSMGFTRCLAIESFDPHQYSQRIFMIASLYPHKMEEYFTIVSSIFPLRPLHIPILYIPTISPLPSGKHTKSYGKWLIDS
jgi:hypothetical protein